MSSRFLSHLSAGRFCKQLRAWSVVTLGLVSMSGVWAQGLTLGGISGQGLTAADLGALRGAGGLSGVARSMPTSTAVDRVAQALGIPCFETPTGWKFFGSLLDAGMVTLCGEESFGTGSSHVREKDGLWAVLMWLNILACRGERIESLVQAHWQRFGRIFYARHDYEDIDSACADGLIKTLRASLPDLPGSLVDGFVVQAADDFSYVDPVDGSVSSRQGVRVSFTDGSRVVFRLSGTGTGGATLRIYLERFESNPARHRQSVAMALSSLTRVAESLSEVQARAGRSGPSVVT